MHARVGAACLIAPVRAPSCGCRYTELAQKHAGMMALLKMKQEEYTL